MSDSFLVDGSLIVLPTIDWPQSGGILDACNRPESDLYGYSSSTKSRLARIGRGIYRWTTRIVKRLVHHFSVELFADAVVMASSRR